MFSVPSSAAEAWSIDERLYIVSGFAAFVLLVFIPWHPIFSCFLLNLRRSLVGINWNYDASTSVVIKAIAVCFAHQIKALRQDPTNHCPSTRGKMTSLYNVCVFMLVQQVIGVHCVSLIYLAIHLTDLYLLYPFTTARSLCFTK